MTVKSLSNELKKIFGNSLKENIPLAQFTTLKIGGSAEYFIDVNSSEDLVHTICSARKIGVPITILGGGSNVLISDLGIPGLVIKNNARSLSIRGAKGSWKKGTPQGHIYVEADSGVMMNYFVRFTIEEGLSGFEMHLGLPGTVGGAVYMNSKWMHPEGYVGDRLYQATIISPKGDVEVVPKTYFRFMYDSSILQHSGDILISAIFEFTSEDKDILWKRANESIAYRRVTQPQGISSAGCTFRNISKSEAIRAATPDLQMSAGFLLDHTGLKGFCVGGAKISEMHANFIINTGNATALDVITLIREAQKRVQQQFHVKLREEIVLLGDFSYG